MQNDCIAAVDMGTNSFHLIIAKIKKNGTFKVIDRERVVIRLGSHKGENLSFISEEEIKQSIEVLSKFKKLSEFYNAPMRAIATSAVRESHNKDEYINKVLESTGIKVEVIEGSKEAKLIFNGAKKALSLHDQIAFCVDIGGGSTEFVLGNNGEPTFAESVKIGAVRLSKKFFPDYILSEAAINQCKNFVNDQITSNINIKLDEKFDIAVGSSGTIEAAAAMISARRDEKVKKNLNGFTFTKSELDKIISEVLNCRTSDERLKIKGMEAKRADIIPAGLIILDRIFNLFKLKKMTISDYALREGIIFESIDRFSN